MYNLIISFCFSRNLLSLKNYEGDFEDIALNFTVINGELGSVEVDTIYFLFCLFHIKTGGGGLIRDMRSFEISLF